MLKPVCDVPRFVLHRAREQRLFRRVVGVSLAVAVNPQDERPAKQVEQQARLRPAALAFENHAVDLPAAFEPKPAAVGERALAKRLVMASGVEHVGRQKQLHFVIAVRHVLQPVADGFELNVGGLAKLRAELAHGGFHVVRQRSDGAPRDVGGGRPAALYGFFVEVGGVVRPQVALVADGDGQRRDAWHGIRPARHPRLLLPPLRDFAVDANVDVPKPQPGFARLGFRPPLERPRHPLERRRGRLHALVENEPARAAGGLGLGFRVRIRLGLVSHGDCLFTRLWLALLALTLTQGVLHEIIRQDAWVVVLAAIELSVEID